MTKPGKDPADYIQPLNINGLEGRMLRAPSTSGSQREILLIYGHHAMLERWWNLVQNLQPYGNVTMPDMPGFGGMESFNKTGIRPDIDAFADYLASFIKLRYERKKVTIYAISFGFVVVTRMLQRYPELIRKVELLVSVVGFMHKDDLVFSKRLRKVYRLGSRFLATRPISFLVRYIGLNRFVVNTLTHTLPWSKMRLLEVTPTEFSAAIDIDVRLWQANDVRTHWLTTSEFLELDNCGISIKLPVVHVVSVGDHYLENISVEQHMRQVFAEYRQFTVPTRAHVPAPTATKKEMAVLVPAGLRHLLSKKSS